MQRLPREHDRRRHAHQLRLGARDASILHYPDWLAVLTKPTEFFTGEINQYVAIGSDLRTSLTLIMQDKGTSGQVKNDEAFRWRLQETDLSVDEAVGYLQVNLIPDLLTFYLDERFAPSVDTREVFGMMYLPVGHLPEGRQDVPALRAAAAGRQRLHPRRAQRLGDHRLQLLRQPAGFRARLGARTVPFDTAVSQGAVNDRDVQLTGTAYVMFTELPVVRNVFAGLSGFYAGGGPETSLVGLFAGFNLGRFTYLGEVDLRPRPASRTRPTSATQRVGTFMTYSRGQLPAFDWLNVKAAFDYADWDGTLPRQGQRGENRFSFGLEPFLAALHSAPRLLSRQQRHPDELQPQPGLWSAEIHLLLRSRRRRDETAGT